MLIKLSKVLVKQKKKRSTCYMQNGNKVFSNFSPIDTHVKSSFAISSIFDILRNFILDSYYNLQDKIRTKGKSQENN